VDALTLDITPADVRDADVGALVDAHVARSRKYYPPTSCHSCEGSTLAELGVQLFVGRLGGEALVIGGLLPLSASSGEIKSVFTAKSARGRGYGRAMMDHLMTEARTQGMTQLFLETGSDDASAAARGVYKKLGFQYCPPFGSYTEDPLSVFMSTTL